MRYGSVCSGLEAATLAFAPLGWHPAFFAEIEPFCCALLARHYPAVPNLGDFTHIGKDVACGAVDLLIAGTQCQSFSVAGRRGGLADPRGHLTLEYFALVDRLRPKWFIWENVPGVLSNDGGKTFKQVLQILEDMRYSVECEILNAQFHGVPQRRRRVFLVGHDVSGPPQTTPYYVHIGLQALGEILLGCWDESAARSSIVPTIWDSEKGLSADGRQRRMRLFGITTFSAFEIWLHCLEEGSQKLLPGPTNSDSPSAADEDINLTEMAMSILPNEILMELYGARWNTDWSWNGFWGDRSDVASAFTISTSSSTTIDQTICFCAVALLNIAPSTLALMRSYPSLYSADSWLLTALERLISYARLATNQLFTDAVGGVDFWRCVEQCATNWQQQALRYLGNRPVGEILSESESLSGHPASCRETGKEPAACLTQGVDSQGRGYAGRRREDDVNLVPAVYNTTGAGSWREGVGDLPQRCGKDGEDGLVVPLQTGREHRVALRDIAPTLTQNYGKQPDNSDTSAGPMLLLGEMGIRRLTPREAERLQGIPDNYTLIPYRGKPATDSVRYRAIGNSFAVPVVRWIGERIKRVEQELHDGAAQEERGRA